MTFKHRPANLPWWAELAVAAGLALLSGIYLDYRHDDKATAAALSAVTTQQKADEQRLDSGDKRLDRIENKIDDLTKIEIWAHGSPKR